MHLHYETKILVLLTVVFYEMFFTITKQDSITASLIKKKKKKKGKIDKKNTTNFLAYSHTFV